MRTASSTITKIPLFDRPCPPRKARATFLQRTKTPIRTTRDQFRLRPFVRVCVGLGAIQFVALNRAFRN
jgi:hypothetical protein